MSFRRTMFSLSTIVVVFLLVATIIHPTYAATRKLSIPNPNGNTIQAMDISPDGQYVVYIVDHESEFTFELYSVPLAGGSPTKLNPDFDSGQNVFAFSISPNSSSVVYRARRGV